jgi:ribonucleotide reductase beta subunit family protein with ferritin-like domain
MEASSAPVFEALHALALLESGEQRLGSAITDAACAMTEVASGRRLLEILLKKQGPLCRPDAPSEFLWEQGEGERLSLRPIRHDDVWAFRKKMEALHWIAQEVDLSRDAADWNGRMSEDQRHFVKMQLAFFSRVDIDVLANLDENFGEEVDCIEARMVYAAQKDQECVHAESYSLQVEAVMRGDEREEILNAVRTMPIIAKMREWVLGRFDSTRHPLAERLVAAAATEGVLFSASFASLQWLKSQNLLPGITTFNTFIVRDEGIHTSFTCLLVKKYLRVRPTQGSVSEIFESLVGLLDEFVAEALPVGLLGINSGLMQQYVRFQADCVIADMGYEPLWGVRNPFRFMDSMALNETLKVNFFEHGGTQYQNVSKEGAGLLAIDDTCPEE